MNLVPLSLSLCIYTYPLSHTRIFVASLLCAVHIHILRLYIRRLRQTSIAVPSMEETVSTLAF